MRKTRHVQFQSDFWDEPFAKVWDLLLRTSLLVLRLVDEVFEHFLDDHRSPEVIRESDPAMHGRTHMSWSKQVLDFASAKPAGRCHFLQ